MGCILVLAGHLVSVATAHLSEAAEDSGDGDGCDLVNFMYKHRQLAGQGPGALVCGARYRR